MRALAPSVLFYRSGARCLSGGVLGRGEWGVARCAMECGERGELTEVSGGNWNRMGLSFFPSFNCADRMLDADIDVDVLYVETESQQGAIDHYHLMGQSPHSH